MRAPITCQRAIRSLVMAHLIILTRTDCLLRELIPVAPTGDWYARRVGVAAAREINMIPAGRPLNRESKVRPAGIIVGFSPRQQTVEELA